MDFDMDEEYNYTSKEIETEIDSDYYAYYIKEHAYILKNALDRIKKLEEENIQLKKKSEFNVYDTFNDMTSDDDIKDLMWGD